MLQMEQLSDNVHLFLIKALIKRSDKFINEAAKKLNLSQIHINSLKEKCNNPEFAEKILEHFIVKT